MMPGDLSGRKRVGGETSGVGFFFFFCLRVRDLEGQVCGVINFLWGSGTGVWLIFIGIIRIGCAGKWLLNVVVLRLRCV